jgi:tRNA(fMet)-specific endonuclease VapC
MIRYLLDTNAVIALLNDAKSPISKKLRRHQPGNIGISSIVIYELYYGAYKSQRVEHNVSVVEKLQFPVVKFDEEDARESGKIRAALAQKGTPIGPLDLLIAGQAKARHLTLITNNTKEFKRIAGLKIEDWQ